MRGPMASFMLFFGLFIVSVNSELVKYDVDNSIFRSIQYSENSKNISLDIFNVMSEFEPKNIINVDIKKNSDNYSTCDRQFLEFQNSLVNREPWALKMIDSASKIPSGILMGNLKDLGTYDECISIKVKKNEELIRGKSCMYSTSIRQLNTTISLSPTFSICLPAECDANNVIQRIQDAIDSMINNPFLEVKIKSVKCSKVEDEPWGIGGIITLIIFSFWFFFLFVCTIFDVFLKNTKFVSKTMILNELHKLSLYSNTKRIMSMKIPRDNLPGIQGIRFFSMAWVVLGHTYYIQLFGVIDNGIDVAEWTKSWNSLYIVIAPFTVDTFFVMSGFLLSYLFIKEMAKGRKFNPIMYYLHRYLRITPAYGALLLMNIYILHRIGSGPLWEANMNNQKESCSRNWWALLLYIQNYVHGDSLRCLSHCWYLAVDMQFFWISPLIVYPLSKKPKIGLIILSGFFIASIIIPAVTSATGKYSGAMTAVDGAAETNDMMVHFYTVSHTRAGPWLMGILMGYFLAKNPNKKFDKKIVIFCWILAILAFAFGFFSYRIFQNNNYHYNIYWETFYAGFARHIWGFGVCWFIYSTILGYSGIIGKFLSLPVFMPLGRISFCIYLIHFVIQMMEVSAIRIPLYFNDLKMLHKFLADFILCIIFGFLFSLFFESPFMALEKIIFGKKNEKNQSDSIKHLNNNEVTVKIDNKNDQFDK